MSRTIVLKSRITETTPGMQHRLQVWVDSYENVDPAVFVWQRGPSLPDEEDPNDFFVNVASAVDLEEYPVDEPTDDIPFFRQTSFDILFRSVADLYRSWNLIQDDVRQLLLNLRKLEEMGTEETIEITV